MYAKICKLICVISLVSIGVACEPTEISSPVDKTKLSIMAEQVHGTSSYVLLEFEAGELAKWIEFQLISYYQYQTEEINESYFRRIPVTSENVMFDSVMLPGIAFSIAEIISACEVFPVGRLTV